MHEFKCTSNCVCKEKHKIRKVSTNAVATDQIHLCHGISLPLCSSNNTTEPAFKRQHIMKQKLLKNIEAIFNL